MWKEKKLCLLIPLFYTSGSGSTDPNEYVCSECFLLQASLGFWPCTRVVDPNPVGSGFIWVRGSGFIWVRGSGFRIWIRIQRYKIKGKAEFNQQIFEVYIFKSELQKVWSTWKLKFVYCWKMLWNHLVINSDSMHVYLHHFHPIRSTQGWRGLCPKWSQCTIYTPAPG